MKKQKKQSRKPQTFRGFYLSTDADLSARDDIDAYELAQRFTVIGTGSRKANRLPVL